MPAMLRARRSPPRPFALAAAWSASKWRLADGHEPDVCRLPHAQDQRVAPGRELPSGLLDRERRQLGAVVGEQDRTGRPQWRQIGRAPCQSTLSGSPGPRPIEPERALASSGGEYHAGTLPARKRSRSGAWGRAPLSA